MGMKRDITEIMTCRGAVWMGTLLLGTAALVAEGFAQTTVPTPSVSTLKKMSLEELMNLVRSVPRDIARLTRDARRGKARIDLDIKRLDSFGDQLDKTLDRVTMGIMTASLVIGSSIVMTVEGGPLLLGIPVVLVIGFAGYLVAFLNSVWVIYGIWRQAKR